MTGTRSGGELGTYRIGQTWYIGHPRNARWAPGDPVAIQGADGLAMRRGIIADVSPDGMALTVEWTVESAP